MVKTKIPNRCTECGKNLCPQNKSKLCRFDYQKLRDVKIKNEKLNN